MPIAVALWIIQIVSVEESSNLMENLMHFCCCTCSVTLNVTATQYICSFNGIYHPHWLVEWSHCSHVHIPVHSPCLPGYIAVEQTVLIVLTVAYFFQTDLVYFLPSTVLPTSALVIFPWVAPFPYKGLHSKSLFRIIWPLYSSLAHCPCREPLFNPHVSRVGSEMLLLSQAHLKCSILN